MFFFALLIGGICVLNALKFLKIVDGGLDALHMDSRFQMIFYIYMSTLATIVPPSIVWLVLRRLTDSLRNMAARDPMTDLLNRRGLQEALTRSFNSRNAGAARLLLLDVDHFKRINDTYGHQAGDEVICQVADILRSTVRNGDLTGRIGGEEFVAVFLEADGDRVIHLAERLRASVENQAIKVTGSDDVVRCRVTIGVSPPFHGVHELEDALREADAALYRGKAAGRNRIESADVGVGVSVEGAKSAIF
jgi:diguanylate cyclase (GGDEF)-like protein